MSKWIKWGSGVMPVFRGTVVEVKLRNGMERGGEASSFSWAHAALGSEGDIVAYRIVEPVTEEGFTVDYPVPSALHTQQGGSHYKDLKIQPIEYIHANNIPFAEGCVIKYMTRWRAKGGIKDLEKAKHFIDLLIELESKNGSV